MCARHLLETGDPRILYTTVPNQTSKFRLPIRNRGRDGAPYYVGSVGDLHVLVYIIGFPNIVDNNSNRRYHHLHVTYYQKHLCYF